MSSAQERLKALGYSDEDIAAMQAPPPAPEAPVEPVEPPVAPTGGSLLEDYLSGVTDRLTSPQSGAGVVGVLHPYMRNIVPMIDQQVMQEWAPESGDILGSIYGGVRGAQYGPKGVAVGTVVGATAGRFLGEGAADVLGDDFDMAETLANSLESGAWALAGEAALPMVRKGLRIMQDIRAGSKLTPERAAEMQQINEFLKNSNVKIVNGNVKVFKEGEAIPANAMNVTLTPAQVTESPLRRLFETVAKAGFGGGQIDTMYEAQAEAMRRAFGMESAILGSKDPKVFGQAFQNAYNQVYEELAAYTEPLYKQLDALAAQNSFNFTGLRTNLRGMLAQGAKDFIPNKGKSISAGTVNKLITNLPDNQASELKLLLQRTNKVTFDSAFSDIQRLTKMARELRGTPGKAGYAKDIDDIITVYRSTLKDQSKKLAEMGGAEGVDLYKAMNNLDTLYGDVYKLTRGDFALEILEQYPSQVAHALYGKPGLTEPVTQMMKDTRKLKAWSAKLEGKGIDAKKVLGDFKATYVDNFMRDLMSATGDDAIGAATKRLEALDPTLGNTDVLNTYKAVLSPAERKRVTSVLKFTSVMEQVSAGNFSLAVRGQQVAGLRRAVKAAGEMTVTSALGGVGAGTGALVGAPAALAGGILFFASPRIIARNAVKGKLTDDILKQALGIAKESTEKGFDSVSATVRLLSLIGRVAETSADLPPELVREGEEDIPASVILRRRMIDAHNESLRM